VLLVMVCCSGGEGGWLEGCVECGPRVTWSHRLRASLTWGEGVCMLADGICD